MKVLLPKLKKTTHWALIILTCFYLISGLGILYSNIVEKITFGLLTKSLSFQIHYYLLIPFLIVLVVHIFGKGKK
jgi:hypothetical protein